MKSSKLFFVAFGNLKDGSKGFYISGDNLGRLLLRVGEMDLKSLCVMDHLGRTILNVGPHCQKKIERD